VKHRVYEYASGLTSTHKVELFIIVNTENV